ncbi:MAG TPA: class I SAM-dependent methyltransferase [Gemmatimonas sp.]|uniref:class I SAM-dependent DNA methyltransferase n=1 Tax=Gemmatimonas sp. TaxID=1962908 RepID=UPI002ED924C4
MDDQPQDRPLPDRPHDLAKRYDQAYFDKWYRHPKHRVKSPAELARQVAFVLGTAEFVLGRPVRSVLDVGCGEGQWRAALRAHRSRVHYDGVDPSAYAVERFGARRNLHLGGIETLDALPLRREYDLVVCCGMLNYLSATQLTAGLSQVAHRVGGMAYLELFTREDHFEGDTNWPTPKPAHWYRDAMLTAGLTAIGMQCYVQTRDADRVSSLERS